MFKSNTILEITLDIPRSGGRHCSFLLAAFGGSLFKNKAALCVIKEQIFLGFNSLNHFFCTCVLISG